MTRKDWDTVSVLNDFQLECLLRLASEAEHCALDLETTSEAPVDKPGLHDWHWTSRVVSISLTFDTYPDRGYVVPLSHPDGPFGKRWREVLGSIAKVLLNNEVAVIGHNLKFDLRWILTTTGVDLTPVGWFDTMMSSHLLDENSSRKLKNRAAHLMGGNWGIDVAAAESVPWFPLAVYNAGDTVATYRLFKNHHRSLKKHDTLGVVFNQVSMPSIRALTRAESHGMLLDVERTRERLADAEREAKEAEAVLMETAGSFDLKPEDFKTLSWEPTALWFKAFMEEAMDRDILPLVEVTGKGAPSWRKGVLNRLVRLGALGEIDPTIPEALLHFRHGTKQAQFLRVWLDSTDHEGRVHPTYNVANVVTGRLSSSNPNAQQISRELKSCWTSPEGWWIAEADQSQIEMRVAAEFLYRLLGDNPMMAAYQHGLDLHTEIAALVAGITPGEVTKDQRQSGKAVNFGFLFGMGAAKFVDYAEDTYGVFFTRAEAEEVRRLYFERWKGLAQWHEHQRATAGRQGFVTNLFGRIRHLPAAINGDDWERSAAERQAINSPVQSTASDLMLRAIAIIDGALPRDRIRAVGTVHDSTLFWVRQGHEEQLERAANIMLDPLLSRTGVKLTVPLAVDAEWGTHWSEPKEERTFASV